MKDKVYSVTFGGIGGQGVLKASELCSWAALYAGYHVKKSEVHGMSQRGGSVESHVRFGRRVYSPLVPAGGADVLLCFHQEEHPRLLAFLKKEGLDLTGYVDKAAALVANPRGLNTCLVGVLSARLPIREECWMQAIETVFKGKGVDENKKVFLDGRRLGQS
ncbi:MAG: indolepyruvate oxidoreductase subunit beta [Planctomycetes bacterium]|jgi:indolepyruvate ferredoxin oxidoreductase beta subunit|nr:indolepyruvate oxidoreductase subunit beta [Planctomycetota bacterium]